MIETEYLERIYFINKFKPLINKMVKEISKLQKKQNIDAIAFTGTSGAAVAYPLSYILGIPLICIRKGKSHTTLRVEGAIYNCKNYIIVDDLIASGNTIKRIISNIRKENTEAKPIKIYLYNNRGSMRYKNWEGIPIKGIS